MRRFPQTKHNGTEVAHERRHSQSRTVSDDVRHDPRSAGTGRAEPLTRSVEGPESSGDQNVAAEAVPGAGGGYHGYRQGTASAEVAVLRGGNGGRKNLRRSGGHSLPR